jgi:hypothetical protein
VGERELCRVTRARGAPSAACPTPASAGEPKVASYLAVRARSVADARCTTFAALPLPWNRRPQGLAVIDDAEYLQSSFDGESGIWESRIRTVRCTRFNSYPSKKPRERVGDREPDPRQGLSAMSCAKCPSTEERPARRGLMPDNEQGGQEVQEGTILGQSDGKPRGPEKRRNHEGHKEHKGKAKIKWTSHLSLLNVDLYSLCTWCPLWLDSSFMPHRVIPIRVEVVLGVRFVASSCTSCPPCGFRISFTRTWNLLVRATRRSTPEHSR